MPQPLPSPSSPPGSAPWPRGATAQPPRSAPSWRAMHRGRWPCGGPGQLCVCPAGSRTASPQPAAPRTRRPTARRPGLPPPRPRAAAAASPHHPPSSSESPSPPCGTPRAASKHQGSPGS
eukprot:scaffold51825_cov61-Phaeocystis_antarctica.AAC.3